MSMAMKVSVFIVVALLCAVPIACGGSDDTAADETAPRPDKNGPSAVTLRVDPGGKYAYTETEVSAKAGDVTITLYNPQPFGHLVALDNSDGEQLGGTEAVSEADSQVTFKNLEPGTYTYYCTVPGHREAGMEGTLTLE